MNNKKATLESQLFNTPCMVEDTEEMFWLRDTDDYQSKISLGISRKTIAYPIGIWHYLMKDYANAAKWFMECLPC